MIVKNKAKIVIWGTGGFAELFMEKYTSYIHWFADLICVVDDCENRVGSFFYSYEVHSLNFLDSLDFDYCIECEYYHDLSYYEAKKMLSPDVGSKFLQRNDYLGFIIDKIGFLDDKKILFLGDKWGVRYDGYAAWLTLEDYSYAESIDSVENMAEYDIIFICPPMYISIEDANKYENRVISSIDDNYKDKVVPYIVWREFMTSSTRFIGKGSENPDKRFLVIMGTEGRGWAALLIHFYSFIRYAFDNDMIPVIDMKNFKTQYIEEKNVGTDDIWLRYFLPVSEYSLEEVYNSKNVYLCPREYSLQPDIKRSFISLNEETKKQMEKAKDRVFGEDYRKILGVLYRGTDFYTAYGHDKPYNTDYYFKKIDSFLSDHKEYDRIFLATEVKEVVEEFKDRYGEMICYIDQKRFDENERRILSLIEPDDSCEHDESFDYLSALYLFICCDSIMGIRCGGTMLADILRKDFEYKDIFKNKPVKKDDLRKKYIRYIKRKLGIGIFSKGYKLKIGD